MTRRTASLLPRPRHDSHPSEGERHRDREGEGEGEREKERECIYVCETEREPPSSRTATLTPTLNLDRRGVPRRVATAEAEARPSPRLRASIMCGARDSHPSTHAPRHCANLITAPCAINPERYEA